MNLALIPKAFDFLRKGEALAHPGPWKVAGLGATAGALGLVDQVEAFLLSLAALVGAIGYDFHFTQPVAHGLALGIVWAVGLFFTVATTDKLGVLPAKPADGPPGDAAARVEGPLAAPARGGAADAGKPDPVRPFNEADREAP